PNQKYNSLQEKGWSQGKMKAMLHHHVNQTVIRKIEKQPYEGVGIAQFCDPAIYQKHLQSEQKTMPDNTYFKTKAEQYSLAVAADSILARASFLKKMDELSIDLGIKLAKRGCQQGEQKIATINKTRGKSAF